MPQPNLLLIYTDQWRFDALGCAGHPDVQTPHLDRFAQHATRFSHHFVQSPVCMPSRLSMLSGRYPSNVQTLRMGVPVDENLTCVQHLLTQAGYHTANLGKLHFLPHSNRDHRQLHPAYGFQQLEIADEPGPYEDAYRAWVRTHHPQDLDASSSHVFPPAAKQWREINHFEEGLKRPNGWDPWKPAAYAGSPQSTFSAFVGQRTLDFLQDHQQGPPFLCVSSFYSPHSPLVAPQAYFDLYNPNDFTLPEFPPELQTQRLEQGFDDDTLRQAMHGYYAMISEVDHWIGQIFHQLKALDLLDSTVVAFTSDHGEFLGEHLRWGKWHPAPDCVQRVPLIVGGPTIQPNQTRDEIVEAVDLVPTLLELVGIQPTPQIDGQSLVPALRGVDSQHFPGKPAALCEDANHDIPWRSLRTQRFRYLLHADGEERLHDLDAEFGEYRNVADQPQYADPLNDCRKQLAQRMIQIAYDHPPIWPY